MGRVIDVNLVNIIIIGAVMMLWRFAATMLAAWKPDSKIATAVGFVAG